jgi:hypothetical protein
MFFHASVNVFFEISANKNDEMRESMRKSMRNKHNI